MGKCVLNFDQMEILNKKSDTPHSDNDWMIIYWFVSGKLVRTDRFPLYNTNTPSSVILDSGNAITPFASDVGCADNELVTATFQVINLGSSDFSKQAEAAEKFAEQAAKDVADAYVKAAEFVVRNIGIPLSSVYADGIHAVAPAIVNTVGVAFEDAIIPLLNDIVDTIFGLLGKPNCNGDVLHDTAVFLPEQPNDLTISQVYTASSVTFCGSPARTSVHLTLQRVLDAPPTFSSQPPPDVDMAPAKDEPSETWFGTWAEDVYKGYTPTPIIVVTIANSTAASGLLEVTITEHVDQRFDARFDASNNTLSPHNKRVFIFTDDVFAYVRPWTSLPVRPAGVHLQFSQISTTRTHAIDIRSTEEATTSLPTFRLLWNRPLQSGGGVPLSSLLKVSAEKSHLSPTPFIEQVEVLEIANQGVTLCLYRILVRNTVIGHSIRYIRDENLSFTRADVMLMRWSPIH